MPWWSTLDVAAWKISLLASTTAARTSSSEPAGSRRRLSSCTVRALATSPALCPPMPSATANIVVLDEDAVLVLLADPARIGDDAPAQLRRLDAHCAALQRPV